MNAEEQTEALKFPNFSFWFRALISSCYFCRRLFVKDRDKVMFVIAQPPMVILGKLRHSFLTRFAVWPDPCHLRQVNGAMAVLVQIRRDNSRELLHFGLARNCATLSNRLSK